MSAYFKDVVAFIVVTAFVASIAVVSQAVQLLL